MRNNTNDLEDKNSSEYKISKETSFAGKQR